MRDYPEMAAKALKAYLDRGLEALKLANLEDLEKLEEQLRLRRAAFYNFKAADKLACDNGIDIAKIEEFRRIRNEIESVDEKLQLAIQVLLDSVSQRVTKFNSNRKNMGKYHSGIERKTRQIAKTV